MRTDWDQMLWAGWLHLVEGMTQDAVAQRLGMTRAKVNRLVAACRDKGLVQVSINTEARFQFEVERALIKRYGLTTAFVVPTPEDRSLVATVIGIAAGAYVSQHLLPGQTLALGWGRTLDASVRGLNPRSQSDNTVVTLMGGLARSESINPYDIAARYARSLAAECYYLIAPVLADTAETAAAFRRVPAVQQVLVRAAQAHLALAGAGGIGMRTIEVASGLLTYADQERLQRAGAVGNIFGHYIKADGTIVDDEIIHRRVIVDHDAVRGIPERIVAAGGPDKVAILRAALSAGFCTVVISDLETATALLANPAVAG